MARITIEDCTKKIANRFELVVLASRRAKDIASGIEAEVDKGNDKDPVVALREIAESKLTKDFLVEELISSYQDKNLYRTDLHGNHAVEQKTKNQRQGVFTEHNLEIDD